MPIITDTSQETALRLHRAAEPLNPPDDRIVVQTGWPGAAGFFVSDALMAAFEADLLLPAPATPNCRANNPCYSPRCGEGMGLATGATAGTPGTWTPSGSVAPSSVADLLDGPTVTASPATVWGAGQYVQTGTPGAGGQAHWDGNSWETGVAPTPPAAPPTISNVSPFSFAINTGLQPVTVNGTGYTATDTIQVDGVNIASTAYVSPTQLTGQIQTNGATVNNAAQLRVVGPGGPSFPSGIEFTA